MAGTSGTYTFNPSLSETALEVFDRLQIRPSSITPDHMISFRRSVNYVFSRWTGRGVNLWTVDLQTVPLIQGVTEYAVPTNTVQMLDVYLRIFQMGSPVNQAPLFATALGSPTVTVTYPANGLAVQDWLQVVVPVSIGGIIVQGFYQVVSVTSGDTFTITAAANATSAASGGVVPTFATVASSTSVTVTLPNHGYLAGQTFPVQVITAVGGISLQGDYTISSVTNANTFVITNGYPAGSTATASENGGLAQLTPQSGGDPVDRVLMPISRTDYAALPDKYVQAPPTTYWYDRLINPTVTLWQVPDQNGPYELRYYRWRQIQDANPQSGQTADIPYRFQEALAADIAAHMAIKWKPEAAQALMAYAKEVWSEAAIEDSERVSTYISPQLQGYFT